ncbi:MAG: hypothetical protein ACRCY6_06165 [Bacteroidales bacterium]
MVITLTATELQNILKGKIPSTLAQIEQLQALLDRYPWFTIARIGLLSAMKQNHHNDFKVELNKTVLHVANRASLGEYLSRVIPTTISVEEVSDSIKKVSETKCIGSEKANIVPKNITQKKAFNIAPIYDGFELIEVIHMNSNVLSSSLPPIKQEEKSVPLHTALRKVKEESVANSDFVTETLAEIYLKQGLIQEAKEIYTQLGLLYPEKKAYFASRFSDVLQITAQQS